MSPVTSHLSVMPGEVLTYLAPRDGGVYLDGTFGAGGHSRMMLEAAECRVLALDRDITVAPFAATLQERFPERFLWRQARFSVLETILDEEGIATLDGALLDIGVSSMQLDTPERGFSFRYDASLDMRMGNEGKSGADWINQASETELADIFYHYGEERRARVVARRIVQAREETPITRTGQLAELVASVVGRRRDGKHPATRVFQALRIAVNAELEELEQALGAIVKRLKAGGRLVVIAFHSLEDRLVKRFFASMAGRQGAGRSRHLPDIPGEEARVLPRFRLLTRRAVKPGEEEVAANPRARSARLRALECMRCG